MFSVSLYVYYFKIQISRDLKKGRIICLDNPEGFSAIKRFITVK